jgi:hypothetical protein
MRLAEWRSFLVVRESDCQSQSCNSPSPQWNLMAVDEAVLAVRIFEQF